VGPPGCPVVHRTSPVDCPVCHPRVLCSSARAGAHLMRCSRPLPRSSRCSAGSPDSPVCTGHVLKIPEGAKFGLESPGAPDTVRCHTGQSGSPDQGCLRLSLALFVEPIS
jgi:hypothetical protein